MKDDERGDKDYERIVKRKKKIPGMKDCKKHKRTIPKTKEFLREKKRKYSNLPIYLTIFLSFNLSLCQYICLFTSFKESPFFHAIDMLVLIDGCTIYTFAKRLEKKLDGNYTMMLHGILN